MNNRKNQTDSTELRKSYLRLWVDLAFSRSFEICSYLAKQYVCEKLQFTYA